MNTKKGFAVLRIIFGLVWAVDAYFKWQPAFATSFINYITGSLDGQPFLVKEWITLWIKIIGVNPSLFALLTAVIETIIALGLIFGFYTRYVIYLGIIFSFAIWSTAEGFGGPYKPGSTDIGVAIIYVLVFVGLILGKSWEVMSFDARRK